MGSGKQILPEIGIGYTVSHAYMRLTWGEEPQDTAAEKQRRNGKQIKWILKIRITDLALRVRYDLLVTSA